MKTSFSANTSHLTKGLLLALTTFALAFLLRMAEWPSWQDPEFRLGSEWLLATHDAYHWVAGAEGFGLARDHPMAFLLRGMTEYTSIQPASIAFWFPMILASLVAVIVFAWVWALGSMEAGLAAGLITTLSPGFLARTLLGFYDTDLITLFIPLLMTLVPAGWAMRHMILPYMVVRRLMHLYSKSRTTGKTGRSQEKTEEQTGKLPETQRREDSGMPQGNPLKWHWILGLSLSGLLASATADWHSVFPYLLRYNCVLLICMAIFLVPRQRRGLLVIGALTFVFPSLLGLHGLLFSLVALAADHPRLRLLLRTLTHPAVLTILCLAVCYLLVQGDIAQHIISHINAYVKHSGDVRPSGSGTDLVYPSVAQSIVEVQDLNFATLLSYFHPWPEAAFLGLVGFVAVLFCRAGTLFLLPLAVLALLSTKLGGRMVMFGAPIIGIGLSMPLFWIIQSIVRPSFRGFWAGFGTSMILIVMLIVPFVDLIPAMSQGPMINRRHADALTRARAMTPQDAMLWLWWDWGYAAHHFSRRNTIADGAQHAGPSLYLPAAVFATDKPRFARQLMRYTAAKGNIAGNVFAGLDAEQAQKLIQDLHSHETPLVESQGRIFIITSFEMLRLGFWISNFGNWNFLTQKGEGGALSIVPQELSYRLETGEVRLEDGENSIYAASISIFEENSIIHRNYIEEWANQHPDATEAEQKAFLQTRRNVHFLFNKVTGEKLAVDERLYYSLMIRLLICDRHDPLISPYFKLVYDNVFARIYEVL